MAAASTVERRNQLVQRLQNGEVALGGWFDNGDVHSARAFGDTDLDFVIVDMEHSGFDFPTLGESLQWLLSPRKARARRFVPSPAPIVRLPCDAGEGNQWLVKQTLDYGAFGVLVPRVQSAADAGGVIRAARYSRGPSGPEPQGHRGMNPALAMRYWGCSSFAEYFDLAELWPLSPSGECVVLAIVEDEVGFENIEEIAATPGLGGVMFGAYDGGLALGALGAAGQPGFAPLEKARARVLDACHAAAVPVGTAVASIDEYAEAVEAGFNFVATTMVERSGFADIISSRRAKRRTLHQEQI